jgi:ABC-type transporter Mla MlaB component
MHRLPAEVRFDNANAVLEAAAAAESGAERTFDLSACERFDSSLIAIQLELLRRAREAGARCRFEGSGENLLRLAGLYGITALLFGEHGDVAVTEGEAAAVAPPGGARA